MFNIKNYPPKKVLFSVLAFLVIICCLFFIMNVAGKAALVSSDVYSNAIKVRNSSELIDMIFERAEVNVNLIAEVISNSYDISKQQNKDYNLAYIKNIDGVIKSALGNSQGANGVWFQINADLPFSLYAYNWYGIKDDDFINIKDEIATGAEPERKLTPENDPYYFNAITSQGAVWSDVYIDADTQTPMITISIPVNKDSVLIGVAGIDISIETLQDILSSMQPILGNCELYLINDKDSLIASKLYYDSDDNKIVYPYLSLLKSHKYEPVSYFDGLQKKAAIMLKLSNNYNLIIVFEDNEYVEALSRLINTVYILFALVIILVLSKFVHINFKIPEFKRKVTPTPEETQVPEEDTPQADEEL